jgi:carbon-monoxide dehydrogenase medium subunit
MRKMRETRYLRARDVADAAANIGQNCKLLAGGLALVPQMKQRVTSPKVIVDLIDCKLSGIEDMGASIKIGAMCTHDEVGNSSIIKAQIPALATLAAKIGDPQVRNRATLGGSLAHNDPAGCYPAAAIGLDAVIHTNKRDIAADDFFTGTFETALDQGEIIIAASFTKPISSGSAGYAKCPHPASRNAMVAVFVARMQSGVRVAITGAKQTGVFRHAGLEAALGASFTSDAVNEQTLQMSDKEGLLSDLYASREFRAHLMLEMTRRAIAATTND